MGLKIDMEIFNVDKNFIFHRKYLLLNYSFYNVNHITIFGQNFKYRVFIVCKTAL